jgi:uncharacterized protein YjbJ (UPF0337 family)
MKEDPMGADDKVKNQAQDAAGHVKEGVGQMTGNEDLEAKGKADQASANLKKAGEDVKDAFKG